MDSTINRQPIYLKFTVLIILLTIILFFSAWVRFDGITEQGISGEDAFRYVHESKLWAEGQRPKFGGRFYRPCLIFYREQS